jgi:hypothetical protein
MKPLDYQAAPYVWCVDKSAPLWINLLDQIFTFLLHGWEDG